MPYYAGLTKWCSSTPMLPVRSPVVDTTDVPGPLSSQQSQLKNPLKTNNEIENPCHYNQHVMASLTVLDSAKMHEFRTVIQKYKLEWEAHFDMWPVGPNKLVKLFYGAKSL